jgi:hypothetical protein
VGHPPAAVGALPRCCPRSSLELAVPPVGALPRRPPAGRCATKARPRRSPAGHRILRLPPARRAAAQLAARTRLKVTAQLAASTRRATAQGPRAARRLLVLVSSLAAGPNKLILHHTN